MSSPMPVATVQLFYALLSLVALGVVAAVAILRGLAFVSPSARRGYARTVGAWEPNAVGMAWVVAILATVGSLYFSEIAHYEPCRLCWFQRIAMYPLVVVVFGLALRRDGRNALLYALAMPVVGAGVSIYHEYILYNPQAETA